MEKTIVVFRKFKDHGDVIAIFPAELWADNLNECTSYMHVGQHGGFSLDALPNTTLATPEEYKDLLAELVSIGYDNLVLYKKMTRWMTIARIWQYSSY